MNAFDLPSPSSASRRGILKAGVFGALGLGLAPALAACSNDDGGSAGQRPLLMSHLIANLLIFEETRRAFDAAASALDFDAAFTSHDGDVQKSLSQVNQFPTLGVKGVHTYQVADPPIVQYGQTLAKNEIYLFDMSNRLPWLSPSDPMFNGYYLGTAMPPADDAMYISTKLTLERAGGKGDMIVIRGPKGSYIENAFWFGVQAALAEFPEVRLVATEHCDWNQDKARIATERLITAYPDTKYVVGLNDDMAFGAITALQGLGNTKAYVNGSDGSPPVLEMMQTEERLLTVATLVSFQAVLAVTKIYDALNGVKFHPLEDFLNPDAVVVDTPGAAAELLNIAGPDASIPWDAAKMSRHINGDDWTLPHRVHVGDPAGEEWANNQANPNPRPADFAWPDAYQASLDNGELQALRDDWDGRFVDTYAAVRKKADYKDGVLGKRREATG